MAFGFFRRHQKMVMVIMVILMVAFLVGIQGVNMIFGRAQEKTIIGTTKGGNVLRRDLVQANRDVEILTRYLGLAFRDAEFLALFTGTRERALAYAILLIEAKGSGVEVASGDVTNYLDMIGYNVAGEEYALLMKDLKASYAMPDADFEELVGRWLTIKEASKASMIWAPPSAPRVERLFHDLNEKIELRVVKVPAEKFFEKQTDPTPQQIDDLFSQFRGVVAGTCGDEDALGFGYYQPDRVAIHFLLISKDVISRVTRVDEAEGRRHYRRNKSSFVKKVPVKPPQEKDEKEDSKSNKKQEAKEKDKEDKPVEYKEVEMTLTEAMPQIMAMLTDVEAQRRMDKLVGTVQGLVGDRSPPPEDVYQQIVTKLALAEPAAAALAVKIADVSIKNQPLSSAIDTLATSAGLRAICYPWGRPVSDGKILPADKKVSLEAKQIALAEALERIGKDLKVGPIEWAMCEGFEGILFPLAVSKSDVRMFPVSVETTRLLGGGGLADHAVLGRSFTSPVSGGQQVGTFVLSAEDLERSGRRPAVMSIGQVGPEMYVRGEDSKVTGRVLWQLSQAVGAHEPKVLTDLLRWQVIRDFKIREAFTTNAKALANEIEGDALKAGLVAAAKASGLADNVTGLFARKRLVWDMPPAFLLNDVPFMELPAMPVPQGRRIRGYILRKVFAIAPSNVEPPYPDKPKAIAVIPVAALRAVFVVERIDYRPPVRSEYENQWQTMLTASLMGIQRQNAHRAWFGYENIIKRTGFKEEEEEEEEEEAEARKP